MSAGLTPGYVGQYSQEIGQQQQQQLQLSPHQYQQLQQQQQQQELAADTSRFSDSESEDRPERLPASKSPSEFLSSAFGRIKKIAPNREDIARLTRQPSQLGLRRPSESSLFVVDKPAGSAPLPGRFPPSVQQTQQTHHARSVSLHDSLEKPLPEPPPTDQLSPLAVPTHQHSSSSLGSSSLATIVDSEVYPEANADAYADGRSSTMGSTSENGFYQYQQQQQQHHALDSTATSSQSSLASLARLHQQDTMDDQKENLTPRSNGPPSAGPSPQVGPARTTSTTTTAAATVGTPGTASSHLSGLMCNVHRTTGREPHPLVGATTTVLGDKLYVFGGRILSRSRPAPLTADLYELDLVRRHWTKLETTGDVPPPRYFHSMCALGDTKMVCYGGMSPSQTATTSPPGQDQQTEVTVMSDIYIYDAPSKKWTYIPSQDPPQGRYAHCACILSASAIFASHRAPLSALQHNPATGSNSNEGRIGINIDGIGGAEMIVVGGQDGANHYIEQISVFNLRSLKWTSTQPLGKSCGAYRSVVAPLAPSVASKLGASASGLPRQRLSNDSSASSMLIYSNYNFLDVKLELQVRASDGSLGEQPMSGTYGPPGLRFPNGGVTDTHFVVSGTYLTSSKQEYALWALDLRSLTWTRIDAGGAVFSQGSWNRGVLWNRRNTFVVLGNRKRSLVDDYNHRRINFSNVCMVELEAFGFYDNPRRTSPMSGFVSASSPYTGPGLSLARKAGVTAGGRSMSRAAEELGERALQIRELADMDVLCIGGERIAVNSRIVARRWGPYFVQLLREGTANQDGSDAATLRSGSTAGLSVAGSSGQRNNSVVSHSRNTTESMGSSTVLSAGSSTGKPPSTAATSVSGGPFSPGGAEAGGQERAAVMASAPTPRTLPPNSRPRCLYLPHTYLTVQALLHFVYTSSLPPPSSPLCTPQILCSLLQVARPYRVDGLLEAVVERLHGLLDSRNAAAVFNATAMAAGGGRGIDGSLNPNFFPPDAAAMEGLMDQTSHENGGEANGLATRTAGLRINTAVSSSARPPSAELSATSMSGSEWSSDRADSERGGRAHEVWAGELSSVIGLQKRGLRGLMEGRRMRERTGTGGGLGHQPSVRVGLGISGS